MSIKTIILAAGQGTRMRSSRPKVLHEIADKALLQHVYETSAALENNQIFIIYGHGGDTVKHTLSRLNAGWIEQKQQLGTGHAVQQAIHHVEDADTVLILYGDVPLLKLQTIQTLLQKVSLASLALLTVNLDDPTGYGRIVRDKDHAVVKNRGTKGRQRSRAADQGRQYRYPGLQRQPTETMVVTFEQ